MEPNSSISLRFFCNSWGLAAAFLALLAVAGCPGPGAGEVKKSETRLDLAKDFLRKGQLEAAETEGRKALGYNESNGEAYYVLGLIELMRSHSAHRLLEIDECLTGADADALGSEKTQHLVAAEAHFARASELDPEYGESWAGRGTAAMLLGRYDQAIEYLSRALGLPARLHNIALVRANLGWTYFQNNDLISATKELLQASQFQPGMCVATYRLGRVYFARKEWEKSLQKFRELAGHAECPIQDVYLFLMKTYVELGATEGLQRVGQSCVALAPRSCVADQCRTLAAAVSSPPSSPSGS